MKLRDSNMAACTVASVFSASGVDCRDSRTEFRAISLQSATASARAAAAGARTRADAIAMALHVILGMTVLLEGRRAAGHGSPRRPMSAQRTRRGIRQLV